LRSNDFGGKLDVRGERDELKLTPSVLFQTTGKMVVVFTEMGKNKTGRDVEDGIQGSIFGNKLDKPIRRSTGGINMAVGDHMRFMGRE